jgi:hypothetical protein
MSSTASSRTFASALALLVLTGCVAVPPGKLLFKDDFRSLDNWHVEAEKPGQISAANGVLDIDVPAGVTLWFKPHLEGPLSIEFEATAVAEGGPNDQVSDLNVFWMANNVDGLKPVFAHARSGKFEEYNALRTYYVGLGGNRNTTTRFRRYIGDPVLRPLRPEDDLAGDPSGWCPISARRSVSWPRPGHEYWRNGTRISSVEDAAPRGGWFALRGPYRPAHLAPAHSPL